MRTWTMTVVAGVRRARAAAGALGPGGSASVGATCRWFQQTPYRPEGGVQMHNRGCEALPNSCRREGRAQQLACADPAVLTVLAEWSGSQLA